MRSATEKERKFYTITVNTESCDDSIASGDTAEDVRRESPASELEDNYRTIRSTGARVSLDENHRHCGEMSKFIESTVNKRKSCSLPNILDMDDLYALGENCDDLNKTGESSDLNLSFDESEVGSSTPERKYGRGSTVSIQVCGKEHLEEPCFICVKDNEIYCSVCVEVSR